MTDHTARPRRSALYMPGSKPRALDKARSLAADALILDLEDAVVPAEKPAARDTVTAALAQGGYGGRELIVRINGLDTPWGSDDLIAAARSGADVVLIPKVESAETIHDVSARLDAAGARSDMAIWAMMETPRGMLNAAGIAEASPRLACLVMGTNDLVKELDAQHTETRLPVITALGLCMLAARANGQAILDGVYNAYKDDEGLRDSCTQGREFGFDGKTLINPAQLAVTNEVFGPDADEIALAERYLAAFAEAEAGGQGVAVVDGRIVENLHVETARKLLARADAIKALAADQPLEQSA
ncbi:MAG: HpcH/HpaI aldolase/citrate lyase family protein [Paracoccaceae bacterium]